MMLKDVDKLDAISKMQLLVFKQTVESSPWLCETKKVVIERLLQQVVDVWTNENFV